MGAPRAAVAVVGKPTVDWIESAAQPDGAVIEQLQSAYKLGERLLRPARVVVSKGAPPAA